MNSPKSYGVRIAGMALIITMKGTVIVQIRNGDLSISAAVGNFIALMRKGEPMNDLISRQAAIDAIEKMNIPEDMCVFEILSHIEVEIATLPSAQPERKKGSWNVIQGNIVMCSECGMCAPKTMTGCLLNRHLEPNRTNFCPNCGADMRKREGDNV